MSSYTVGVDLGTVITAAAVSRGANASIVDLGEHASTIPSVVCRTDSGTFLVGDEAERRVASAPASIAREFKRRVGDSVPMFVGGAQVAPEALEAEVLRHVLARVTSSEGLPPSRVVLTYPASWGPMRLELVRTTARLAGAPDVAVLSEPLAAAYWYGAQGGFGSGDTVAVYDLGGAAFHASLVRWTDTGLELVGEPLGIDQLGGVDFDVAVVGHVVSSLSPELDDPDIDDPTVRAVMVSLRRDCVLAKEALSTDTQATIDVVLASGVHSVRMTRTELEAMMRPQLTRSVEVLQQVIRNAGLQPTDIRCVLLSGGSSRIPIVAQLVGSALNREVVVQPHPKYVVALGAALAIERGEQVRREAADTDARRSDPLPMAAPAAGVLAGTALTTPVVPVASAATVPLETVSPTSPADGGGSFAAPPSPPPAWSSADATRAGSPGPSSEPRRSSRGLLIGILAFGVVALAAAVVFLAMSNKSKSPAARDTAADPPSASSGSSASNSSSAAPSPVQRFATQLDSSLQSGPAARAEVVAAVNGLQGCTTTVTEATASLEEAITTRQSMLDQIGGLDKQLIPQGTDVVADLQTALSESIAADQSYLQWAQFVDSNGCDGNAAHNSDWESADQSSQNATAAKKAFVQLWDPIAAQVGSKTYQETDL